MSSAQKLTSVRLLFQSLLFILSVNLVVAQEKFTISGYIRDGSSGEELIGATIFVKELGTGTSANIYGYYSITIPKGTYTLNYSFLGLETQSKVVELTANQKIDIELGQGSQELQEVVIEAEAADQNVTSTQMSSVKMDVAEIKKLPVLFGEVDILKTITLMPGVQAAGEGNTGFFVRGGGPDQNLILLDEAPVYNASHLLGFFSVFNSDAIKDMQLMKGGIPAQYGGRLSSVLDIKMNEGNMKKTTVKGGIGLIASRLTVEAPLKKDKSSFILSGRRTYADLFLKLSNDETINQSRLYFYDLSAKVNYIVNDNNRLFVSGYFGRDVFGFSDAFGFTWGNTTATVRWNHLFNDKLFMNTALIYSDYDYVFSINVEDSGFELVSGINDINFKTDLQYFPNMDNNIKFGVNAIHHKFTPGEFNSIDGIDFKVDDKFAIETAAYIANEQKFNDKLSANYGLRYNTFSVIGPGEEYRYDENDQVIDTTEYANFEMGKFYHGLEPRAAVTYKVNNQQSVKGSYNRMRQNLHLLSPSTSGTPIDLWVPSSSIVQPEISDQVALGYFRNFKENKFESSIEVYYKTMQNQIDYKPGANILLNATVESELLFGDGWSYGAEFLVRKKKGLFTGWIGYTLSRTVRQFDGIDEGEIFPSRYDRTHDISVVGTYQLSDRISLGATWVYNTGNAVTFPVGKYEYDGDIVNYYSTRNGDRMPAYHRGDVSLTLDGRSREKFKSSWNFSVYNVYGRKNAYSIEFRTNAEDPTITEAVKISLFTFVPAVTWNFEF